MFRRFVKSGNNGLDADQLSTLARANQLMENAHPAEAAPLFAGLAAGLEPMRPRRAANIHARAAHAYADAGQEPQALAQARSALSLFIRFNMAQRTPVFYANIRSKFNAQGMTSAAASLASEFRHIPAAPPASAPQAAPTHGVLPTNCPKCGAPVRANEAEWIDARTLECSYCGAGVRTLEG
jgi:hypothetical protein